MSEKFQLIQRVDYLKQLCKGKKVLHLGCTNYPYTEHSLEHDSLLHIELGEIADELWGFDFDQRGLDILSKRGIGNLHRADLEKLEEVELNQTFDVIIAGEMIEHLSNPGLFLKGIKRFMNPQTNLVITTINAYCGMRYAIYALRGKQGVNEPVHQDHVAYYSYSTLRLIISREDLSVEKFTFYDMGTEHRPHQNWIWNIINDVSVKFAPQLSDGIIAECRLAA
jgi:2-polyprenyl-3-methyl-5-hydroxy-6-metoxy-1,4-benzoquinol methylase